MNFVGAMPFMKSSISILISITMLAAMGNYTAVADESYSEKQNAIIQKESYRIGHTYYLKRPYNIIEFFDQPNNSAENHSSRKTADEMKSGPYKIVDIVKSNNLNWASSPWDKEELFFKVLTPNNSIKYISIAHGFIDDDLVDKPSASDKSKNSKSCDLPNGSPIGANKKQIQDCYGKPRHINTTVTARFEHEQWVYPGGYVYFDNDIVTAYQLTK